MYNADRKLFGSKETFASAYVLYGNSDKVEKNIKKKFDKQ